MKYKKYLFCLVPSILIYLTGVFWYADFNIKNWDIVSRAFISFVMLISIIGSFAFIDNNK